MARLVVCPGFFAVGLLDSRDVDHGGVIVPRRRSTAFRRKVQELIVAGRPVGDVAEQLGASAQVGMRPISTSHPYSRERATLHY